MEVEGHHQVIDGGMVAVVAEVVQEEVVVVVLVGADLVSHAILNFEVSTYRFLFYLCFHLECFPI